MKDIKDQVAESLNNLEIPTKAGLSAFDPARRKFQLLLLALLIVTGVLLYMTTGLPSADFGDLRLYSRSEELGMGREDPCGSTEECLMIYLKPPCHECERLSTLFAALQNMVFQQSSSIGVMLVVGGKNEAASLQVASKLQGEVFFDFDDGIPESLTVTKSPAWILRDKDGDLVYLQYGVPKLEGSPVEKAQELMVNYISKRKSFKER